MSSFPGREERHNLIAGLCEEVSVNLAAFERISRKTDEPPAQRDYNAYYTMPVARLARASDLTSLLSLFAVSEVSATAQPEERAEPIWQETLTQQGVHIFVADDHDRIAATCMLITAPNLLRGGRRHAFLENVVTHPELRGRGYGKAVVQAALDHAWATDCYHVLLQSGRTDPRVHAFYRDLGFDAGLRVAYVARRPSKNSN